MATDEVSGSAARRAHDFHALFWHFGACGPQDVHLHPCLTCSRNHELVGAGRECDGKRASHHEERYVRGEWRPVA